MSYWAMNTRGALNTIRYEIFHEHIANGVVAPHVAGTFQVGGFSTPGQWLYWWLVTDAEGSPSRVVVLPSGQTPPQVLRRFMGAWGTEPRNTSIMMQQQVDRVVTFRGDYDFDKDIASTMSTNGKYFVRGNHGGWPPNKCCALYFRCEVGRADKSGVCQVNLAAWADDNTDQAWYVTQAKGMGTQGEYASVAPDNLRVILDPKLDSHAIMINENNRGLVLLSGYELTPS